MFLSQLLIVLLVARLMSPSMSLCGLSVPFKAMGLPETFGRSEETGIKSKSPISLPREENGCVFSPPSMHLVLGTREWWALHSSIIMFMGWKPVRSPNFTIIKIFLQAPWWSPISHSYWIWFSFHIFIPLGTFPSFTDLDLPVLDHFPQSFNDFTGVTKRNKENNKSGWSFILNIYLSVSMEIKHGSLVIWEGKADILLMSDPLEFFFIIIGQYQKELF